MNTPIKIFLLTLNCLLFCLALYWVYKTRDIEPILTAGAFLLNCITLAWGDTVYEKVSVKKVSNTSDIQIDQPNKGSVRVEDIDNSKINIKK